MRHFLILHGIIDIIQSLNQLIEGAVKIFLVFLIGHPDPPSKGSIQFFVLQLGRSAELGCGRPISFNLQVTVLVIFTPRWPGYQRESVFAPVTLLVEIVLYLRQACKGYLVVMEGTCQV